MDINDTKYIVGSIVDLKLTLTKHISRGFHKLGKIHSGHGRKNLYKTLFILDNKGSQTPSQLCQYMDIRKSTMTAIIELLTEEGFVSVENSKNDRRKKVIQLTKLGKEQASNRKEIIFNIVRESLKQLSDDSVKELMNHLNGIKEVLARLN